MEDVRTAAKIEKLRDIYRSDRADLPATAVRVVEVDDASVDAVTILLALPIRLIRQLGLERMSTWRDDPKTYSPVRLTIQGRDCSTDVVRIADDRPVRVGRLPLLQLDLVADVCNGRLGGNPAHVGVQTLEI